MDLYKKQDVVRFATMLIGVAILMAWLVYDIIRTKKPDDKFMIPAYVQSVFINPVHKTRSAQLIYYDYKQMKCRLKTVSINHKMGGWERGEMVYVIVGEGKNRVRFMAALAEIEVEY